MSSESSSSSVDAEYVQATKQQVRNMVAEIAQLAKSDADPSQFHAITCESELKCRACSPMYSWSLSSVLARPAASVMT